MTRKLASAINIPDDWVIPPFVAPIPATPDDLRIFIGRPLKVIPLERPGMFMLLDDDASSKPEKLLNTAAMEMLLKLGSQYDGPLVGDAYIVGPQDNDGDYTDVSADLVRELGIINVYDE